MAISDRGEKSRWRRVLELGRDARESRDELDVMTADRPLRHPNQRQ